MVTMLRSHFTIGLQTFFPILIKSYVQKKGPLKHSHESIYHLGEDMLFLIGSSSVVSTLSQRIII